MRRPGRSATRFLASLALAGTWAALAQPAVNLGHLDHLSQPFEVEGEVHRGVWIYAEPGLAEGDPYQFREAPGEGVTDVDDVARAAIVYLWAAEDGLADHALQYAREQIDFVLALQADDGEFYNFVFEDGRINRLGITSRKGAGFWAARSLWVIAEGMRLFQEEDPAYYAVLKGAFLRGVEPFARNMEQRYGEYYEVHGFRSPAWLPGDGADVAANLLLGLATFLELEHDDAVLELAQRTARGIAEFQYGPPHEFPYLAHPSFARDPLQWHAWGSRQTQALARAARVLGDEEWLESALAEAGHFFVQLLASQGPVELMQPAVKFAPQIAYGMEAVASGFFELARASGNEVFAELGGLMTSWLFGNNELHEPMYDPATGRTYDGLEQGVINRNSGAESTITALLALVQAHRSEAAVAALDWLWIWKHDDIVLELETGLDFGEPPAVELDTTASGQLVAILEPGAAIVLDTVIPVAGDYRVIALYRDEPWQASARVALGRETVGTVSVGGAADSRQRSSDLGVINLDAGDARFVVSHVDGRELRFDALVLRPVLTQKLYAQDGSRMLLVKGWSEEDLVVDFAALAAEAAVFAGGSEPGDILIRAFDRLGAPREDTGVLPAFGFALVSFASDDPLPDLGRAGGGEGERFSVGFSFAEGRFSGLDLSGLFNNDAFSDTRNPSKGNFDARSGALGATYPAERAPTPDEVVELLGVPYMFPPSFSDANNVAMHGQVLEIEAGSYTRLWVLGASEQGNYLMPVVLEYADGSSEAHDLGLSDWCQLPRYGDEVAIEFTQRRGAGGAVERISCRIFVQSVAVDPARELVSITLPDRETMHAFAITLETP